MVNEGAEISIKLPLAAWRIVLAHLERGPYREVMGPLTSIRTQASAQIQAANAAAEAPKIPGDTAPAEATNSPRRTH